MSIPLYAHHNICADARPGQADSRWRSAPANAAPMVWTRNALASGRATVNNSLPTPG